MAIIRAQDEAARIEALFGDSRDLAFHVIPCRTQTHHMAHPLAGAGNRIGLAGALMVVRRPARGIGVKGRSQIRRSVVTAHGLAGVLRRGNLGQHLRIAADDAGKIHHLAQPDDAGPAHRLGHVLCADFKACGLQPRRGRCAGRHLREDVDRLHQRLVMHHPHTFKAQHIGDLMGVCEHCRGAMRDHRAGKFRRGQHATFDMHMPVAEPRDHVASACVDHLGVCTDAMGGVRSAIGKASVLDGQIMPVQHFACVHVNPCAAGDDKIGRHAACGDSDEIWRSLRPGFQGRYIHVPS